MSAADNRHTAPRFDRYSPSSEKASRAKRNTPRKHTSAEMLLRRALWHKGRRYRLHTRDLPGKPDLVFRRKRVAVFVDGDFWHGRDWDRLQLKLAQRFNGSYWVAKLAYNRERDRVNARALELAGWQVLRFWETDIKADPHKIAEQVSAVVRMRP